jgi:hypothetical protein
MDMATQLYKPLLERSREGKEHPEILIPLDKTFWHRHILGIVSKSKVTNEWPW